MPRERTTRQPAGPGRNVRRPRSPRSALSASELEPVAQRRAGRRRAALLKFRDLGFTRRVLLLSGVVAILLVSFAGPLRIMLDQQRELAAAKAQIAQRTAQISDLDSQLARWQDPAFVKSQARVQLGWVLPGEVGYRVIGADGRIVADDPATSSVTAIATAADVRWWDRLAGSVQAADALTRKR